MAQTDNNLVISRHRNPKPDSMAAMATPAAHVSASPPAPPEVGAAGALLALPVPATYVRLLLQHGRFAAAALLAGSGLTPSDLGARDMIHVEQQLAVFRNAARIAATTPDGALWATEFGRQLNVASHGPLGVAALSAPTLGAGLEVFGQFGRIRAPYFDFRMRHDGGLLVLEIEELLTLGELAEPLVDIVMQIALSFADAVLGAASAQATVRLRRPEAAGCAPLRTALRGRCVFGAASDGIAVPLTLSDLPCPLHDEEGYRSALARCRTALDRLLLPDDVPMRAANWLAARYDALAAGAASARAPALDELAAALELAPRTLVRRLGAAGQSFRALRDREQLAAAQRLLGDRRLTAAEVGLRLGFGDAANFARAFQRLTGSSPGRFRRR